MVNAMRHKNWSKRFGFSLMPGREFDDELARGQERLVIGLAAAQGITAHFPGAHAQFATHQPVRPVAMNPERFFEQADAPVRVRAPQEDDPVLLRCFREVGRQAVTRRGAVLAGGMALAVRGDVGAGALLQSAQVRMPPALPDFLLPAVIEAFDVGLETGFARRGKHRDDAEAQAEVNHAAQTIGERVRTLKAGVVVKLGEVGAAVGAPVFDQGGKDIVGGEAGTRPALGQLAVQRQGIEHVEHGAIFDDEALDQIEGVEFGATLGDGGQMPAGGRRWAALASGGGESGASDQSGQGAGRGRGQVLAQEFPAEGGGSVFAQGRMTFEPGAQSQDAPEEFARGAVFGLAVAAWPVGEVGAEEALTVSALKPFVGGASADAETSGDRAEGGPATKRGDDAATFEEPGAFDMETEDGWRPSGRQAVAASAALRLRSGSLRSPPLRRNAADAPASTVIKCLPFAVTRPFTISCHLPPNAQRPRRDWAFKDARPRPRSHRRLLVAPRVRRHRCRRCL